MGVSFMKQSEKQWIVNLASMESESLEQLHERSYGNKIIYLLFNTFLKGLVCHTSP